MENKVIATMVINKVVSAKNDVISLKDNVLNLLKSYLKSIKDITGNIPDKQSFIDILAEIADQAIVLPQPYEIFDGMIFNFIFKVINKNILDKFLGEDWFEKLKKLIEEK